MTIRKELQPEFCLTIAAASELLINTVSGIAVLGSTARGLRKHGAHRTISFGL